MAAASSSRILPDSSTADRENDIVKEIRVHEVAIAELGNISSSRAVYHQNGNLFFRTTTRNATATEQRKLDAAKAKLQKLNST
ncbi:hypothetical protein Nepgr_019019 [Nepenthes gracilis]|uniref:Uncharacterized protein n=1 Tax=Nepenthes gracilis TaxID=150966 RepID=A0AAD3SSG2_NEPGR|nr:hypothetical protein Nepgr_019019 [Nepenthes gracilis]